jgi:methionyl aminopeptidase
VPHYAKNKAVGAAKEGMCFTIEPMIALSSYRDRTWPDNWTAATMDGKRTAQFGKPSSLFDLTCMFGSDKA